MMNDDPEPKIHWGLMVGISVAVHALVLGGAVMLATGSGPRRSLYAPSMSVNLVGPGEAGLPPDGGPSESVPPPPKAEKAKPKPKKSEVDLEPKKKELKKPKKVVRVPKKGRVKKRKKVSSSQKKRSKRKTLSAKETEALSKIRKRILARAGKPGKGRGGGPGVAGPAGTGMDSYKNEIARTFYKAWVLPQSLPTEDITAVLVIHINRKGQIVKTDVEKSSGNRFFDESVMRAVAKVQTAGGLPPLPPEYSADLMVQGLLFDPKIRRELSR